ncbi:hypothetical protein ACEQ8H_001993 [Pleosporales sp. CAS-2024a]
MQISLDRFTFYNDKTCYVEFACREDAERAVERLHNKVLLDGMILVERLWRPFVWGRGSEITKQYFSLKRTSPSEALRPLLEGRRMRLSVHTPLWADRPNRDKGKNPEARRVIRFQLRHFGIEAISNLNNFYNDKTSKRREVCSIDFKTKEGADAARQAFHGQEMEGRKVWLEPAFMSSWSGYQVAKIDRGLLDELQERGLIRDVPHETAYVHSPEKARRRYYGLSRPERNRARQAEKEAAKAKAAARAKEAARATEAEKAKKAEAAGVAL